MNNIPNVTELRQKIAEAKDRKLTKVRAVGDLFIERFGLHLEALLTNPSKFTSHTSYGEEIKGDAYSDGANADYYINYVKGVLSPLGYVVEKSHDGGGMYSTIVVRWDIVSRPRGESYPEPMIRNARDLRG